MWSSRQQLVVIAAVASLGTATQRSNPTLRRPNAASWRALEPSVLQAGSAALRVSHLRDDSRGLRVLTGAASDDDAERETARITRGERRVSGSPELFVTTLRAAPPVTVDDSVVLELVGLVPRYERFRVGRTTMVLRYEGNRVEGTISDGGAARAFRRAFRDSVFPVNAVGVVVRSLPFVAGYEAVLPVFSAQDTSVTYDTVSVVGSEPYPGQSARVWYVRAAGPTFVTSYLVDSTSRRIVAQELVVRATDTRIRLLPVGAEADDRSGVATARIAAAAPAGGARVRGPSGRGRDTAADSRTARPARMTGREPGV